MDTLGVAVGAFVVLAALAFLASFGRPKEVLLWAIGASGGLVLQIFKLHLFTIVVTLWFLGPARNRRGRLRPAFMLTAASIPIAATTFTGDLVNNPLLAGQLVILTAGAAMVACKADTDDIRRMLMGLLATCTIASLMALLQVVQVIPAELFHKNIVSSLGRPPGIYPEPDYMGAFSAIGVVLAWRLLPTGSAWRYLWLALNTSVLVLAFARAAWVALAAAAVLYALAGLITRRQRRPDRAGGALAAGVFLLLLFALALMYAPDIRHDLATRLNSLFVPNATDISGQARVRQTDALQQLAGSAPWYGHGISASGQVTAWGDYDPNSKNSLGTNWLLAFWVDAKYLAVPLIALVVVTAARTARTIPGQLLVLLAVNDLFSNMSFTPVFWLVLGLALATQQMRLESKSVPVASGHVTPTERMVRRSPMRR